MKTISTHAPLAGRDGSQPLPQAGIRISTHAPLAGRDVMAVWMVARNQFQPTRPLRGATVWGGNRRVKERFQPTRPLRGATLQRVTTTTSTLDFNPRAPCGARLSPLSSTGYCIGFQPTRPLRGATGHRRNENQNAHEFQPTRPLRGATFCTTWSAVMSKISTHAPLAGRDW